MLGKFIRAYVQNTNTVIQGEVVRVLPQLFVEGKVVYIVKVEKPYKIEGIVYNKQATVYTEGVLKVLN